MLSQPEHLNRLEFASQRGSLQAVVGNEEDLSTPDVTLEEMLWICRRFVLMRAWWVNTGLLAKDRS